MINLINSLKPGDAKWHHGNLSRVLSGKGLSPVQHHPRMKSWFIVNWTKWNEIEIQTFSFKKIHLTHWGRVTHVCVSKQTMIGSDNGLSPGWCQAIIWTNAGILLIGTLGTNFSEILIEIWIFSFKKMGFKVSSAKWRPFCLGLNVLTLSSAKSWPFLQASLC